MPRFKIKTTDVKEVDLESAASRRLNDQMQVVYHTLSSFEQDPTAERQTDIVTALNDYRTLYNRLKVVE